MVAHFMHYVCRTIRMRFPMEVGEVTASTGHFARPAFHVTHAVNGWVRDVREHDVIWLVSQLKTPWGSLPPGIDARIEVASIEHGCAGTRFTAGPRSAWIPMRDATELLGTARGVLKSGGSARLWTNPERHIGQYLQGMRALEDGALVDAWFQMAREAKMEFVSYRQLDGTRDAFHYVAKRVCLGKTVFWDRWGLPRGIAERREASPRAQLDPYLTSAMDRAATVWGIASPRYGEPGSYSAYEQQYAGVRLVLVQCPVAVHACTQKA